jgi:spore maturation protein SpmA
MVTTLMRPRVWPSTAGSTMDVTFLVTNTGDVRLSPVTVTDDAIASVSCPATELAVGGSMTCTATSGCAGCG